MLVWLITVGEPLPTDEPDPRLLRTGLLARTLEDRSHSVVWWTSSFDHVRKTHRFENDTILNLWMSSRVEVLHGIGYKSNVSLRRLLDHALLGLKFKVLAAKRERPDVIVASLPTLELAAAACRFGKHACVPVVVDVRDLWPDVLEELAPSRLRPLTGWLLGPYREMAVYACSQASAITGPTSGYVGWGLKYAGRSAGPWDRVFPFGYSSIAATASERAEGEDFWKKHGVTGDRRDFIVCFFGTLGRQFDIATVIEAARVLRKTVPRIRFVICGTGEKESDYRTQAAGCDNMLFPGWVGRNQISALMRMAAVGLAPYRPTANFGLNVPNKPIEYMSAGLPVVTCLDGALGRLLKENDCGVFYSHGDSRRLAETLTGLFSNQERLYRLSANARRIFKAKFAAEKVYEEMATYLECIAGTGQRALRS